MDNARLKAVQRAMTPLLRCIAAGGVWYVAAIVFFTVWSWDDTASWHHTAMFIASYSVLPWLITAAVHWTVVRQTPVKPWILVVSMLPVFAVLHTPVIYLAFIAGPWGDMG